MKTFYEVMDFDTSEKLTVSVELIKHNDPKYEFTINSKPLMKLAKFDLLDTLTFRCIVSQGAIEIAKITINDKEVMPIYLHLSDPKTSWITDSWTLTIPGPFYPWYHQITGQGWIA
jgi:hypothetical protein